MKNWNNNQSKKCVSVCEIPFCKNFHFMLCINMFTRCCYPCRISSSITQFTSSLYAKTTNMIFPQRIAFFVCILKLTEFALAFILNLNFRLRVTGYWTWKRSWGNIFRRKLPLKFLQNNRLHNKIRFATIRYCKWFYFLPTFSSNNQILQLLPGLGISDSCIKAMQT